MVLTGDRITKVSLGKYDQVVALTQFMINNGLRNLWKAHRHDLEMNSKLDQDLGRGLGSIAGVLMEAPRIQMDWRPNDARQLTYFMHFKRGTLMVNTNKAGEREDLVEFDMESWILALPVVLGTEKLEMDDPIYQKRKAALVPGQYSVTRLLVALSEAESSVDLERSLLGSVDWKQTWNETVRENVLKILQRLVKVLFKYTLNTIGYSVTNNSTQLIEVGQLPTFQPTDLRFQTYPWCDPDGQTTNGLTGNSALNYLLYLEMTDGHELPGPKDATLPYRGNWTEGRFDLGVDGSSVDYGTFAMSGKNFLEAYLLPKLRPLNKILEPSVNDLTLTLYWDWIRYYNNWDCDVRVGHNVDRLDANDPAFDFKRSDLKPSVYEYISRDKLESDRSLEDGHVSSSGSATCFCKNTVEYTPGSPEIVIKGESDVALSYSLRDPSSYEASLQSKVTWKITLTLESVSDGGLQISVKADKPVILQDYGPGEGVLQRYGDWLKEAYHSALSDLSEIEAALVGDLSGQHKFYFPASGTFFFKDPVINAQGALICSVGYNGTDDFRNPNRTTERKIVQANPLPLPKEPLRGGISLSGTRPGASEGEDETR